MKRALWITCGVRGNAGDALLDQVTRSLFDGIVDLDFRYVSEPAYLRKGDTPTDNVIVGPGGLLVQTNSSRHLHAKLAKQWDLLREATFPFPGAGVRSPLGKLITPPTWLRAQIGKDGVASLRIDWPRRKVLWWDSWRRTRARSRNSETK